jgi:hypothetical protein
MTAEEQKLSADTLVACLKVAEENEATVPQMIAAMMIAVAQLQELGLASLKQNVDSFGPSVIEDDDEEPFGFN